MFVSFPCRCSGGVLGCYPPLLQLLLELTWMLPGSLLRYHEKFKVATLLSLSLSLSVAAVAVRAFCTVGQKLQAQGLLIQDVDSNIHHLLNCTRIAFWTMLLFHA